jgi:hypothetical protein
MTIRQRSGTGRAECRRYLPVLLDVVEELVAMSGAAAIGRVGLTAGPDADDHLERCPECRAIAADTALALIRIQRWARVSAHEESSADAWVQLRSRVEASREQLRETAWRARASLAGLITSTLLVGVIVGRMAISGTTPGFLPAGEPVGPSIRGQFVLPVEMRYIRQSQQATAVRSAPTSDGVSPGQRQIPDGTGPGMKEVSPPQPASPVRVVS